MGSALFRQDLRRDYPLFVSGEGAYLNDKQGRRLFDATSGGVMAANIGHGVGEVAEAMGEQARRLGFAFAGLADNEPAIELAENIVAKAPPELSSVFFASTGTEATETAVKFARLHHMSRGKPNKHKVIGREMSYHGTSFATMSYGGPSPGSQSFSPYLLDSPSIPAAYCNRCRYGLTYPECALACATELERLILREGPDTVSCFITEPVVGRQAGAYIPPPDYFPTIRAICDKYDVLWIADEVVTGFGRTGTFFAVEHWGVTPDLLAMGKGISGGYAPLAGILIHERIRDAIARHDGKGPFGYTFAANPISCAAGLAVQSFMTEHRLVEGAVDLAMALSEELTPLANHPFIGDVRGLGLLKGIEIVADKGGLRPFPAQSRMAHQVADKLYKRGVWVLPSQRDSDAAPKGDYLLLAPPLVATRSDFRLMADAIVDALDEVRKEVPSEALKKAF